MNLLTIFGYVIAAFAIALGLFLILRKNSASEEATASDDVNHEPLLIPEDADGQRRIPVIPRHLREQLALDEAAQLEENHKELNHQQANHHDAALLDNSPAISPAQSREAFDAEQVSDDVSVSKPQKALEEEPIDAFDQALAQLEAVTNPVNEDAIEVDAESSDREQVAERDTAEKPATTSINPRVETASVGEWQGESALLDAHLEDQDRRDDESALAQAEHILSLYVMPSAFRALSGERTIQLLRQFGLRFGEMSLFHRFQEPDGDGPLMFSVLRYTQEGPSGFDLETLSTEQVDGLAFFLALPSKHAVAGYDMMVSIASLLAREIAGQVFDEQMNELTPQLREHYRHFVLDYRSVTY